MLKTRNMLRKGYYKPDYPGVKCYLSLSLPTHITPFLYKGRNTWPIFCLDTIDSEGLLILNYLSIYFIADILNECK